MRRLAVVLCFVLLLPAPTRGQENRPATLKNADEIRRKMMEEYPLEMRRRGVSGRSVVEMMVRDNGKPAQIRLSQRSGSTALDHAALDLARDMRFDPARSGGEKVDQKVRLPLAFESSCGLAPERTKQPETTELLDGLDVVAIQQLSMSPPGAVLVDVHVDTAGRPTEVGVLQSSGVVDADSLAVRTIRNSRYEPLTWKGDTVAGRFRDVAFPRLGGPANPADECTYTPPVVKNADFLKRALKMVINGALDRGHPVSRKASAMLWVRPDGRVGRAYITGSSCWDEMDSYLVSVWMAAEFEPAMCRGEPIGVYTIFPFELGGRLR